MIKETILVFIYSLLFLNKKIVSAGIKVCLQLSGYFSWKVTKKVKNLKNSDKINYLQIDCKIKMK